jgi:hypothetical protein
MGRLPVVFAISALFLLRVVCAANWYQDAGVRVAMEWNDLHDWLLCTDARNVGGPGLELVGVVAGRINHVQLHLAQWHALIAAQGTGTSEVAAVAYASHRILSHYYSWAIDKHIDPLLQAHLAAHDDLLAQRVGEAVADDVAARRTTTRPVSLGAVKAALRSAPKPGLYRPVNASANFVLHGAALATPFVLKDPEEFIVKHILPDVRPPEVPSAAFTRDWEALRDVGRIDFPGRTREMNLTADFYGCQRVNTSSCAVDGKMHSVIKVILPKDATLAQTVTILAKMSVAIHDAAVVLGALQYGFWFWRPVTAFRTVDPTWTPYAPTPPHPEFPSGTVVGVAAAARMLELELGDVGAFSVPGVGVNLPVCGSAGLPEASFNYSSLADVVRTTMVARMWAGGHWNSSVEAAGMVGGRIAEWVHAHWAQRTPSGVLPDSKYLKVVAQLPKKVGRWSPIRFAPIHLDA